MITELPPYPIIAAILAVFLLAGTVKGSLGIGFPAVAMSLFPIFIDPALGVTLLAIPIVVTNGQQFLTVRGWPAVVRRFLIAGASVAVTIFIVSLFVADVPSRWINVLVGVSLVLFALSALFRMDLPVTEGAGWQLAAGIGSGLIGGVSAVKAPIMVYTVALKLPREEFIAAAGFLFFCGGIGLVGGLSAGHLVNDTTLPLSIAAVLFALLGFQLGARIRKRLSAEMFRKLLLWAMLILGVRLIAVNLF